MPVARWHQGNIRARLQKYGLRYDDLRNEFDPEVIESINRLEPEEVSNRNKRLKRAMDLSLKKTYMDPDSVKMETPPFVPYMDIETVKREQEEKMRADLR